MNILIFGSLSAWDDITGGMEKYITKVSERLARRHKVHVIVNNNDEGSLKSEEVINRVNVHRLSYSGFRLKRMMTYPRDYARLASEVVEENDIEVIHSLASYPMGRVACRLGNRFSIPSVISVRNTVPSYMKTNSIKRRALKETFKRATGIQTVSRYISMQVKLLFGRKAFTVYNGVDARAFSRRRDSRLARKLGLGFPTILCVSHYRPPQKRQDMLIRAGKIIARKHPKMRMVFIGRGYPESLSRLAKKLDLDDNVIFLGEKPQGEIPKYLSVSDVFALPTSFEGLPNVALEALAAGVPVVATDTGSMPEVVKDCVDGRLVPLSFKGFAAGILDLLSSRKRLKEMGRKGAKKVRKEFTWDRTAKGIEAQMLKLVMGKA